MQRKSKQNLKSWQKFGSFAFFLRFFLIFVIFQLLSWYFNVQFFKFIEEKNTKPVNFPTILHLNFMMNFKFLTIFTFSSFKLEPFSGWMAIMSLYSSGRDPQNFTDPLKFTPERWLRGENATELKVFKPHASMPFAIGARSCVGKKIATYEIHCLITKVNINAYKNENSSSF